MDKRNYKDHLILKGSRIIDALIRLDELSEDAIIFVVDEEDRLLGSLTDGDVRRGLIKGLNSENIVDEIIQTKPKFLRKEVIDIEEVIAYREEKLRIIPVLDNDDRIINIINFGYMRSYLPIDAVIMAGGRGQRLMPLTNTVPKPMLMVGLKPIIEHNLDRLALFGIDDFWISVKYLGEKIEEYLCDGKSKNVKINYIWETEPLGTIGAVSKIGDFKHNYILITNSDILTNVDYESFFLEFLKSKADFSVLTIPYKITIPYAVLETEENRIKNFKEKPTYTYYSNGGIYLMKKEVLKYLPKDTYFNTTDLMESLLNKGYKVLSYPLEGYWLDIGSHDDYKKAQIDITQLKF